MGKKSQNHRQRREEDKQQRLEAVRRPAPEGVSCRVPKLCREEPLSKLCELFYGAAGVDLFIGVPANVRSGPQTETIAAACGQEVQIFGMQVAQLYAVCINAAMKNASDGKEYAKSSLDLLLEESGEEESGKWNNFLEFINLVRQYFCHYVYLWPGAVSGEGFSVLRHYLEISAGSDSKFSGLLDCAGPAGGNAWLRLQAALARTADEFYAWLEAAALARGGDPGSGTWKEKFGVLYLPPDMNSYQGRNWMAPIEWWWKAFLVRQRSGGMPYDKTALLNALSREILSRENGSPAKSEKFVLLQDQIYGWAQRELRRQYANPSHTPRANARWSRG